MMTQSTAHGDRARVTAAGMRPPIATGPEFILNYWGAPLHYSTPDGREWLRDKAAVVDLLKHNHDRLRVHGYSHTAIPDRKVTIYHDAGAAVEVIWSRCRVDGSEIERLAVHFEVSRASLGWRVDAIQAAPTTADSLDAAWRGTW